MADVKISDLPAAGAITGAELVPIVQGGVTSQSTVDGIKNGAVKVYRALVAQSGTNNPTATVLENTLGGTPVWTRTDIGEYWVTLAGAFPQGKTLWDAEPNTRDNNYIIFFGQSQTNPADINRLTLESYNPFDAMNAVDFESTIPVTILVYP